VRQQFTEVQRLQPELAAVETQAKRIMQSTDSIDQRRQFVDELYRRITELGALGSRAEERTQQLNERMEAAEERFTTLGQQAEAADKVARTVAGATNGINETESQLRDLGKVVSSLTERCESVEALAVETQSLRKEIEQRTRSVRDAAKDLERT